MPNTYDQSSPRDVCGPIPPDLLTNCRNSMQLVFDWERIGQLLSVTWQPLVPLDSFFLVTHLLSPLRMLCVHTRSMLQRDTAICNSLRLR